MTPGEEEIASIALLKPRSLISSLSKINILEPKLSSEISILAPLTIISLTSLAKVLFKNEIFVESIINKKKTVYDLGVDKKINKFGEGKDLIKVDMTYLPNFIIKHKNKYKEWFD